MIEAVGLIADNLPEPAQAHLLSLTETPLKQQEEAILETVDTESAEASLTAATERVASAREWFKEDSKLLEQAFQTEGAPERLFIAINHPHRERLGLALAKLSLGHIDGKKTGLFGRLFGR